MFLLNLKYIKIKLVAFFSRVLETNCAKFDPKWTKALILDYEKK